MPYTTKATLPDQVKDNLPSHAQEIYKSAFNSASKEYKNETTAHKVAWSAVKKTYVKNSQGTWTHKEGGET